MVLDVLNQKQLASLEQILEDSFYCRYSKKESRYIFIENNNWHDYDYIIAKNLKLMKEYLKVQKRKELSNLEGWKDWMLPGTWEGFRIKSLCCMLELPLSDMPLYLNSFLEPIRVLAKWRITEGA